MLTARFGSTYDLSDQPHVAGGVEDRTLEHLVDGFGAGHDGCVVEFHHRLPQRRPGGYRALEHRVGVVHEELDPHGREARRTGAAGAMGWGFLGEEELCPADIEPGHYVSARVDLPQHFRTECGLVERHRSLSVADCQHWRDLGLHD